MAVPIKKRVEARWQQPFWDVVRQLAEQGLCKLDVCRALDVHPPAFYRQLNKEPNMDPFPVIGPPAVVSEWLKDTGEPFGKACARMAEEGLLVSQASKAFGFASTEGFRRAMRDRGIKVVFPQRRAKPVLYMPSRRHASKWRVKKPGYLGWFATEALANKAAEKH